MFSSNMQFLGQERDRERYQEAEHIRLVKIARGEPLNYGAAVRKIMAGLGRYMVKWGNELQAYGVTPLPKATSEANS